MIGISRPLRVLLAGSASIALVATGATALLGPTASAATGDATQLVIEPIYPTDNTVSAGTCAIYRVVPKTALGDTASDSGTIVINLQETGTSQDKQDVDFCLPPTAAQRPANTSTLAGTPVVVDHGYYTNGSRPPTVTPAGGTKQAYCAGESITPPAANCSLPGSATNNPDAADNSEFGPTAPTTDPGLNSNPSGKDFVNDVRYNHDASQGAVRDYVEFGVVGLTPGSATIGACIDLSGNGSCSASNNVSDIQATTLNVTFNAGGAPGSVEANNAVTNITADKPSYTAVQSPSTPANIVVNLTNSSPDTVFGVTPKYRVLAGPNASSNFNTCTRSTDFGDATCSYTGAIPGTDQVQVWVDHTGGSATPGPDAGEPTRTVFVTTYAQAAPANSARTVDLTPNTPTSQTAGQTKVFTAFVSNTSGTPVQGVQVTFTESGPGIIQGTTSPDGNTSSKIVSTGADGTASITISAQPGEAGNETVTATIPTDTTQCGQTFNGQTGTCTDSSVNAISGGPSPSATPTRTATPTATPTTTSSATPSPTGSGGRQALTISTSTPDIQPTQGGVLNVTGQPGASVELRCYTRPDTNYFTARGPQALNGSGRFQFQINPGANTRCYVRYAGEEASASNSVVINVHTTLSLSAVRTGVRTYVFQGRNLPRRSGQLITLYRIANGQEIRTSNLTTDSSGIYRVTRKFTGIGTFQFRVRTSQTLNNAAGASNVITVNVH